LRHRKRNRRLTSIYAIGAILLLIAANAFPSLWEHEGTVPAVNPWFILPFVALLGSIAVAPFINRHWWESNYDAVAYTLGIIVAGYYLFTLDAGQLVARTAFEYVSFISLIGSLYIVAGGIHIGVRGRARPEENAGLLAMAAVLANVLGTTGASMIFIRPFIRMNRARFRPYHLVFFIFIVSNIGGALTPIGDPPLFLGYLKGVPFFWVLEKVGIAWLLVMVLILAVFYIFDLRSFRSLSDSARGMVHAQDETRITGVHNILFLLIILGAVFIDDPAPKMLREVLMWGAALGSLLTTPESIHDQNEFTFGALREVAVLFVGIFMTMMPALDWLAAHALSLGIETPGQFFWSTGVLSSVLDNAPTYLNFLSAAFGLHGAILGDPSHMAAILGTAAPDALGLTNPIEPGALMISAVTPTYVAAISLAAVLFGACTYIGNGPNFMVKSIVEEAKLPAPSFFGYIIRYSLPILIPLYAVVWLLFFHSG